MRKMWLIAIPVLLVLVIGGPGCGKSQEEPKTMMEQKIEKKAAAPMMEETKEMAQEAQPPAMEQAQEAEEEAQKAGDEAQKAGDEAKKAADEAKAESGSLMDTMKQKAVGEANKALEDMDTE